MGLPVATQLKYWGAAAVVLAVVLWMLGDVLFPFVLGGAIAYCLDPLADRLERIGLSRLVATIFIALIVLLIVFPLTILLINGVITQAVHLFNTAPEIAGNIYAWLVDRFPTLEDEESQLRQYLIAAGEFVQEQGAALVSGLLNSLNSIFSTFLLFMIVPVITFYLLLDWDRMVARLDDLLPRDHRPTIQYLGAEINRTLSSFIRGQGTVCLILGLYYGTALMFAGLNFGMIIGFFAGMISFIPYVGALLGGVLAIGLALFQFFGAEVDASGELVRVSTDWMRIGIVAAIFVFGQFFEGNVLSPNLVGSSVGLHPAWLIFALSVFGAAFGFVGLLLAVPLAAVIGVIVRFLTSEYKSSRLYRGVSVSDDQD